MQTAPMTSPAAPAAIPAWVVIADSQVDQICGSAKEAAKEVRDLKAMGFPDARSKRFANWAAAEAWAEAFAA